MLDQVSIRLGNFAPHAQRVLSVDLSLVLVVEEVLGERRCIAQALGNQEQVKTRYSDDIWRGITGLFNSYLEGRVHETRVAQVTEATQARLRLGVPVVVGGAVGIGATQPVGREAQ